MTDATCDLPASILEQMNIGVIPMEFEMAGEVYRHFPDGREMGFHEDVYKRQILLWPILQRKRWRGILFALDLWTRLLSYATLPAWNAI